MLPEEGEKIGVHSVQSMAEHSMATRASFQAERKPALDQLRTSAAGPIPVEPTGSNLPSDAGGTLAGTETLKRRRTRA